MTRRGNRRPGDGDDRPHFELRRSVAFMLRVADRRVQRAVAAELADHGLSPLDAAVLVVVARTPGLSQQALAQRVAADRTTVGAAAAELELEGLLAREPDFQDRRLIRVHAAEHTLDHAREAMDVLLAAERKALRQLDRRQQARLHALLGLLIPQERGGIWDALSRRS